MIQLLLQEIRKQGTLIDIYSPLWSHTTDLIRVGGEYVNGVKVVCGLDNNSNAESYVKFNKDFLDRYEVEATFASVYSYETMMALKEYDKC